MPWFTGTNILRLVSTLLFRVNRCYTIYCLSHKYLHNFYILIGLHHLSNKCIPTIHISKALFKISSYGTDHSVSTSFTNVECDVKETSIDALSKSLSLHDSSVLLYHNSM